MRARMVSTTAQDSRAKDAVTDYTYSLCAHSIPGSVLSSIPFHSPVTLREGHDCYHPPFTDKETEAQKD